MDDSDYQRIKELSWKRKLDCQEQQQLDDLLSATPEKRQDWNEEHALNGLLKGLNNVPVSSNFTARVLQAAQRTTPGQEKKRFRFAFSQWFRLGWAPACITAMLLASFGLFSVHQNQISERSQLAKNIVAVSRVAAISEMDWLKDFDTIDRLSKVQVADNDLLEALE